MQFEWDDENRLEIFDEENSTDEERYITIGIIQQEPVVIYAVYTERGQKIRLISARKATNRERKMYYDGL